MRKPDRPVRVFFVVMLFALCTGCTTGKIIGGPIAENSLRDGIYDGEAKDGPVLVRAKVTIKDQRIADIKLVTHRTWKGKIAENTVPARIIDKQSTSVDAVAGATVSSRAIMNAVETALRKAR
jgi:uncharacterized protein with FMN-binding domain